MRRAVDKKFSQGAALNKAYRLSHPILGGDVESALRVVLESLNEWDVDWLAQKQRTYHKACPTRTPNKMILSRPALLQYIVCKKTTKYEVEQEANFLEGRGSLTGRTLLLRYVKHLLHESASRSFYITVGMCRILHKYDHATTKRFYSVLDQRDQERLAEGEGELDNKTDDEYRRWKMKLVDKLELRFQSFVSVIYGPRNEKRFLPNEQSGAWSEYVRACLGLLTPWETEHILPPEFKPTEFNIAKLKCQGRRDEWDSAEENRMHTIIDPECFSRLAKACGAPAPEQQLDVPQFKSVEQGAGGDDDGGQGEGAPELTFAQAQPILDELERRGTRRRVAVSEYVSVEVDGVECGRLDTGGGNSLPLDLSLESRQIQVFTTDAEGKLLLASLWLSLIDITPDEGWESSIVLEGGQRLGINIQPVLSTAGELVSLAARISYQESNPLRVLTHYFQHVWSAVSGQLQLDAILNFARLLRGAVYAHRGALGVLLLSAAIALSLILPQNSPSPAHTDVHAERTIKMGGRQADQPPVTTNPASQSISISQSLSPGAEASKGQLSGPARTINRERGQITFSASGTALASTYGDPIELWKRALESADAYPLTTQSIAGRYTFALPELSRRSEGVLEDGDPDEPPISAFNNKGVIYFATHGHFDARSSALPSTESSAFTSTLLSLLSRQRAARCVWCNDQLFGRSAFDTPMAEAAGITPLNTYLDAALKEFRSALAIEGRYPVSGVYWRNAAPSSPNFAYHYRRNAQRSTTAESFRRAYALWSSLRDRNDDANPLLSKSPRADSPTTGLDSPLVSSLAYQRLKARNKAATYQQALALHEQALRLGEEFRPVYRYRQAEVNVYQRAEMRKFQLRADFFNLFNDYTPSDDWSSTRGSRGDAALLRMNGRGVAWASRRTASNLLEQDQTPPNCANRVPGSNTVCVRLGVKFEF